MIVLMMDNTNPHVNLCLTAVSWTTFLETTQRPYFTLALNIQKTGIQLLLKTPNTRREIRWVELRDLWQKPNGGKNTQSRDGTENESTSKLQRHLGNCAVSNE